MLIAPRKKMGKHGTILSGGDDDTELQPNRPDLFATRCRQAVERLALTGGTKALLHLLDLLKGRSQIPKTLLQLLKQPAIPAVPLSILLLDILLNTSDAALHGLGRLLHQNGSLMRAAVSCHIKKCEKP